MVARQDDFGVETLLAEACAATGLSDFGSEDFQEPLRVLCQTYDQAPFDERIARSSGHLTSGKGRSVYSQRVQGPTVGARTAPMRGSEYEWGVHMAVFAERVGLTREQVAATVAVDAGAGVFRARDALVLRLADALHDTSTIDEVLWRELAAEFSDEQLLELILLAGFYHTVAYLANGLKIPPRSARTAVHCAALTERVCSAAIA